MTKTHLKHEKSHQLHEYETGSYFLSPVPHEPLSLVQLCRVSLEKLTPAQETRNNSVDLLCL